MLDLMKMDVINFTIQGLRPELHRQSVEYERAKFQSILEKTPSEFKIPFQSSSEETGWTC